MSLAFEMWLRYFVSLLFFVVYCPYKARSMLPVENLCRTCYFQNSENVFIDNVSYTDNDLFRSYIEKFSCLEL